MHKELVYIKGSSFSPFGICIAFITALLLCFSQVSLAVVIDGKDWRQVTETTGVSWDDLDAIYDTATGQCDVADCSIGVIDFEGYTWASTAEVDSMLSTYTSMNFSTLTSDTNYSGTSIADDFLDDFAPTVTYPSSRRVLGWSRISQSSSQGDYIEVVDVLDFSAPPSTDVVALEIHRSTSLRNDTYGAWTYSEVPIPAAAWLFGSGLLGLAGIARSKKTV